VEKKSEGTKKNCFVVVAKLSERRGNMNLPMVQERAGWALLAVNGLVGGLAKGQAGRRGNWG
jgi:hypothetical protein